MLIQSIKKVHLETLTDAQIAEAIAYLYPCPIGSNKQCQRSEGLRFGTNLALAVLTAGLLALLVLFFRLASGSSFQLY